VNAAKRWLEVAGRRVGYRAAGDGPPVILVPGLGLSSAFYQPAVAALAEAGLRAIAPDLWGFGRNGGPFTGTSIEPAADWLLEFATAVDAHAPAWIGHSISCQMVLAIADQAPDRAPALVLAAPTGAAGYRRTRQAIALARVAVTEPPRVLLSVARDYFRANPIQYLGAWIRAAHDHPLERAPRIRAPTLLLLGSRDPVPPPEFIAELIRLMPDARVVKIPGGNHALPLDRPAPFAEHVAEFLGSRLPG
jgi:pimeloyl-ACP methyl ester carboxylesterase